MEYSVHPHLAPFQKPSLHCLFFASNQAQQAPLSTFQRIDVLNRSEVFAERYSWKDTLNISNSADIEIATIYSFVEDVSMQ